MIKIETIFANNSLSNYYYLINNEDNEFFVIDPFESEVVTQKIKKMNGTLKSIFLTHGHHDHIRGALELKNLFNSKILGHNILNTKIKIDQFVKEDDQILLTNERNANGHNSFLTVIETPGHTKDHVCYMLNENNKDQLLFTGDTIFQAGVGNCHNGGDPKVLYNTILKLKNILTNDIKIYSGHDYIENNLLFAKSIDAENYEIDKTLKLIRSDQFINIDYKTTYELEKRINVFFKAKNMEEFLKYRELRNSW